MAAPEDWTEAPVVRPPVYPSCVDVWRIPSGPETSHNTLRGIGAEHGIARIRMELQRSRERRRGKRTLSGSNRTPAPFLGVRQDRVVLVLWFGDYFRNFCGG